LLTALGKGAASLKDRTVGKTAATKTGEFESPLQLFDRQVGDIEADQLTVEADEFVFHRIAPFFFDVLIQSVADIPSSKPNQPSSYAHL
jgi:hypothetical protein